MLPNGIRNSYVQKQYPTPAKNIINKHSYSLSSRPLINYNNSPRHNIDIRNRDSSVYQVGQKMRLMKSRINNLSINSRNGVNQNNLYPTELIFLLSNQESNVDHMKKIIQQEKKRVNRDFDNFTRQIGHMIEDLKLSFHSQLDFVFRDFINLYGNLKNQVIQLRQNRRRIIQSSPTDQYNNFNYKNNRNQAYPYQNQNIHHNVNVNNVSNLNLLEEISRDQDYFKNHKIYEQITNAYFQAIGPIMADAQNILTIGSQLQFYKDEKCNETLTNIRNNFFSNTKIVFENQLNNLVVQTKQIIEDNNMLLKDLNLEDPTKLQRSNYHQNYLNQQKPRLSHGNINQVSNISKKKRIETQGNPYGFQQPPPTFKNHFYQQNQKSRTLRPSSSSDNIRYRQRPQSQWSSRKKDIQPDRQRYNININSINPNNIQGKGPKPKITRDEQGMIVQWTQSPQFSKINTINCISAQDILLCTLFINQGKNIAVGSKDKNIYIFSIATGKLIQTLSGHRASVCVLANFGNFFASGGDNGCSSLILWQTQQWKMKRKVSLHSSALACIVDLMDGSHLATGGYDKKIQIYNYKKSQPTFEVNSCKSGVTSLVVCQQARKLVSTGLDSTLTIWNIFTKNGELDSISLQRIVTNCGLVCSLRSLVLWPDVVSVGNKEGKILILNIHNGQIVKNLTVGRGPVIQMVVIQRYNKSQSPILLTCSNGQREMIVTKSDTGSCQSSKARINISFGCGIGPKVIVDQSGILGIVSQSSVQKQVSIYHVEFN